MYTYKIYNTIIASEIKILNLPEASATDSNIHIIKVAEPSALIPVGQFGTFYSKECCALGVAPGALEVSEGSTIKVYINEGHSDAEMGPFIIGWGFAFLFSQQGYTIFHCSALNISGKGLLLSGASGAGKSSTALSLIKSGAKYLADDMAIMKPMENFDIVPAYPIQKVCRDVSCSLDTDNLLHINEGRDKFSYHNEADYCDVPTELSRIVLLRINDGDEVIVQEQKGLNKWLKTLECMFMVELFATFGTPASDKNNCLKIAEKIRVLEISRPRGKNTLDQITEIINDFVNS